MIKKHLLSFLAIVMLSFSAFAQTPISTKAQFLAMQPGGNYIQTADIDLGDLGARTQAIIQTFTGTYDGNGFQITYQATFEGNTNNTCYGLFGTVGGTIRNLTLVADATFSGTGNDMQVGLLCGRLSAGGVISFCNVYGNLNSTIYASEGGGSDAGLIIGESLGRLEYSSGEGTVVGVGYVGGLIGNMQGGTTIGCKFIGSVTANNPQNSDGNSQGSFGGGIVGYADDDAVIKLCYVDATIIAEKQCSGIASTSVASSFFWWDTPAGNPDVTYSYGQGTVNGTTIGNDDLTNSSTTTGNYSGPASNCAGNQNIVNQLNAAVSNDPNILFALDNDCNVIMLIGDLSGACETPTGLTIAKNNGTVTITIASPNSNQTFTENKWNYVIKGGNMAEGDSISGTTNTNTITQNLEPSPNPYTITVYTDCSTLKNGLLSKSITETFTVDCPFPTNIQFSNITYNSFVVSWNTTANCQLLVNGTVYNTYNNITGSTNLTQSVTGLNAGETHTITIKVMCGGDYEEEVTLTVGTEQEPCYPVNNLSVSNIGINTATLTWSTQSPLQNLRYQIILQDGASKEQTARTITYTNLTPNTTYTVEVREQCGEGWSEARTITFTTESDQFETVQTGAFNIASTWQGGRVPSGEFGHIKINEGHIVTINHTLILKNNCEIENDGILVISGELINLTDNNVGGIVEVSTPILENGKWAFIGAPFEPYKLEAIKPVQRDVSVALFDYSANAWSETWETYQTQVGTGEGYFAWPFYGGTITYTTYGDFYVWDDNSQTSGHIGSYDYSKEPIYSLNNEDIITITKPVTGNNSSGRWIALSNPYTAKLDVEQFLSDNAERIQGNRIYKLTNNTSGYTQTYSNPSELAITDGFFVNLKSGYNSVVFKKTQLVNYPNAPQSVFELPEYIEISLVQGMKRTKLFFARNKKAEQSYDDYDANKLFALSDVVEHYFVTEGIALEKEEVKELPYTAQMNVRSADTTTATFRADNIPEEYVVFLIDNGQDIRLHEGTEYTTQLDAGENTGRFQLLVKQKQKFEEIKSNEVVITNQNREVTVRSEIPNLKIEVYNTIGQKVYETSSYNFTLTEVPAGAYFVKAFFNRVAETQKIVIE
ncbi:MAG: fibronectin type III domain-containing protein [Bacteroidales bacterium]|nr:fibronectin type III domain-containing protein [Bacteroidales bacterium]